ncbi:bzip transcription factor, partial [Lasallia pustulata]
MDYQYYTAPAQNYPFLGLHATPSPSYTPHREHPNDPSNAYHAPNNSYQAYNTTFHYNPHPLVPQTQRQSPPPPQNPPSLGHSFDSDNPNRVANDYDNPEQSQPRSSSEEKESLTPAQSRRKAQNRAAQRAFRERKERHVKDLETKLNSLEAHSSTLLTDNERLKRELARLSTQNEILRATTTTTTTSSSSANPHGPPSYYSPTDFAAQARSSNPSCHRVVVNAATGERLLAAGAAWDLIQGHELFRRGLVDVGDV